MSDILFQSHLACMVDQPVPSVPVKLALRICCVALPCLALRWAFKAPNETMTITNKVTSRPRRIPPSST